ncbi:hypothetical protein BGZ57DRAFT_137055 [Hyaloscypha finlandica]|nr:hypothetical protein BGZ57DRAFT_137055 [Hyaloscypha finlandica]
MLSHSTYLARRAESSPFLASHHSFALFTLISFLLILTPLNPLQVCAAPTTNKNQPKLVAHRNFYRALIYSG